MRLLDQRQTLGGSSGTIDERVAQRVERLRIVRFQLDELCQSRLCFVDLVQSLCDQRKVIDQIRRIGMLDDCTLQHRIRASDVPGVAQQLRLALPHLDALLDRDRRQIREPPLGLVHLAELPEQSTDPELGKPSAIAFFDGFIAFDRIGIPLRFFGNLRKVKIDRPGFAVTRGLEILEQSLGFGVVLHLQ